MKFYPAGTLPDYLILQAKFMLPEDVVSAFVEYEGLVKNNILIGHIEDPWFKTEAGLEIDGKRYEYVRYQLYCGEFYSHGKNLNRLHIPSEKMLEIANVKPSDYNHLSTAYNTGWYQPAPAGVKLRWAINENGNLFQFSIETNGMLCANELVLLKKDSQQEALDYFDLNNKVIPSTFEKASSR